MSNCEYAVFRSNKSTALNRSSEDGTAFQTTRIPWGNYSFLSIAIEASVEESCVDFEYKFW